MKRRVWGPYQNIVKDDLNDIGTFAQEAVEMALAAITPPARLSGLQASAISSNTVRVTAGWMVVSDSTVGRPRLGVLAGDTNLTVSGPAGTYLVVATVSEQDLETRTIAPPPQTLPNGQPNPFYDPTLNPYNQVTLKGWRVSLSLRPGSYTPANREAVVAQVTWSGFAITGVTQVLGWPKLNIADRSIPAIKIADDLAGNGTSRNAFGGIQVNVDNSTIEISSNTLRVKDGGITDAKLGNRTISDGTSPSSDTGTLTSLLSGLANRIKAITGGTTWRDAPATTIGELNANVARKGNNETITGAWTFTGGITIAKPTTGGNAYIARISFPAPSGRNDPAYIEHRETTVDVAELRISISDNDGASNDRLYIGSAPSGIWKPRVAIDTAGKFYWGDGSGTFDVDLYRGGAGTLSTSGTLTVNGNLGVGTTSPSYKLDVNGDANISQTLTFSKGIVTGGGTTFSEVYNTNTSYQIAGANSNATTLHIFSPNNAPVLNLQTNKDADGATMGGIVWTRQGGQFDVHRQIAGIEVVQSGTGVIAGSAMRFWTKASAYPSVSMVIAGNGNVGIGTASPSYKLDVSGDVRWTGTLQGGTVPWARLSGHPSVIASGGLTGGGSLSSSITLSIADGGVTTSKIADGAVTNTKISVSTAKIDNLNADLLDGYDSTDFPRKAENATITGAWTFALDGAGTLRLSKANGDLLYLHATQGGAGNTGSIVFKGYGGPDGTANPALKLSFIDDGNYSSHLAILTKVPGADGNPLIERLRLTSQGRLGIGTSNPSEALEVNGNVKATSFIGNLLTAPALQGNNNTNLLINARHYGMELRIDEDNTGGDLFRVTQGANGANTLFSVRSDGYTFVRGLLNVGGFDLLLGTADQTSRGNSGTSRALVKHHGATLVINYAGDFSGGVRVEGPGMNVQGNLNVAGNLGVGTTSPAYKLDVSGDVRWTGTLQGGTVPWVRLSGYPSVNAGTGLTGGGSLSGNVTLNLATDFIKDFPTGTPSAGDYVLVGPSSGGTNYKVPIGPGPNKIPFPSDISYQLSTRKHTFICQRLSVSSSGWVRVATYTFSHNWDGIRAYLLFARDGVGYDETNVYFQVKGSASSSGALIHSGKVAVAPRISTAYPVVVDAAIVQTASNTVELWVQLTPGGDPGWPAVVFSGEVYCPNSANLMFAQGTVTGQPSPPSPTSGGLFIQWSTASGSSKGFFVSTGSIADGAVTAAKLAPGVVPQLMDFANRFVLQATLGGSQGVLLNGNSQWDLLTTQVYVPAGKSLYLKRLRFSFNNGPYVPFRARIVGSNVYTSNSNRDDIALDVPIAGPGPGLFPISLKVYNISVDAVYMWVQDHIWAEFEIR